MNVVLSLTDAAVEFLWWWVGWGFHNFRVQPNYSVEVVLRCVVVGIVTKSIGCISYHIILISINGKDRY